MKKALLFVFCFAASCLLGFGQDGTYWHASHPGSAGYMLMGYITIDGEETFSESLEIGSFNEDVCVGADWIPGGENPWEEDGHMIYMVTFYGSVGDVVSFKLYDHTLGQELDLDCSVSATLTEDLGCIGCNYPAEDLFVFAFTSPGPQLQTFTLDIEGYGEESGKYYLIASPVTEDIEPSADNGFITDEFDLYKFDQEVELEWINYDPNVFNIESTNGYLYASKTDTQLKFTGTPYSDDGIVPLVYSEENPDPKMHGWNLVGNPFPDEYATVDRSFYIMNSDGDKIVPSTSNDRVPAMNGIFVKADGLGESVTFTPGTGKAMSQIMLNILKDRSDALDRAIVCFDENSTLPKFMLNSEDTKIYIPQDGQDFAVVNSSRENSIPVSFKAEKNGTYTFNVEMDHVTMEYLHLIDNMTGTDVNLLETPAYSFEARTTDNASRFTLVFRATAGVEENNQRNFCFVNGSRCKAN